MQTVRWLTDDQLTRYGKNHALYVSTDRARDDSITYQIYGAIKVLLARTIVDRGVNHHNVIACGP